MKTIFWSGFIIILLSVLLLISGFTSKTKSNFVGNSGNTRYTVFSTWNRWSARHLIFNIFRQNRPLLWYEGNFGLRQEMRKCLFPSLPEDLEFSFSGIPSIAYYNRFILDASLRNHIDPFLLKALIWRESRFNHIAIGGKGEVGLMQIMPGGKAAAADWAIAHHRSIPSEEELLNPELNIDIGAWYLARALKRYRYSRDAVALALCEYNAGPSRAEEWIPDPDTPEESVFDLITISSTRKYVEDIMKKYEHYKNELNTKRNSL